MTDDWRGGGRLTTHVLDTATGRPAAGLDISLYRVTGDRREAVRDARTNADGRCDAALMEGAEFAPGIYELVFYAGPYFEAVGCDLPEPKFLDEVTIRFGMAEHGHYHVPLLLSPFGYSTYRGS